jgi:hypothetical protein
MRQKGSHTKKKVIGKLKPDCTRPNSGMSPVRVRKMTKYLENLGQEEIFDLNSSLNDATIYQKPKSGNPLASQKMGPEIISQKTGTDNLLTDSEKGGTR